MQLYNIFRFLFSELSTVYNRLTDCSLARKQKESVTNIIRIYNIFLVS